MTNLVNIILCEFTSNKLASQKLVFFSCSHYTVLLLVFISFFVIQSEHLWHKMVLVAVYCCLRKQVQWTVCTFVTSDAACRLYFDLEFDRQLNPSHDGEKMVDIFLQVMHALTLWLLSLLLLKCVSLKMLWLQRCYCKNAAGSFDAVRMVNA